MITPQFPRLFVWHVVRYVRRHRLLALLNVVSVALGVAVYVAIQIANRSANESFAAGVDLAAGKAHLEVRGNLDETLWPNIAQVSGVKATTALVEGVVTLPDLPGEYLRILGVDIFSSDPFRTFALQTDGASLDLDRWLGRTGSLAVAEDFARRYSLKAGSKLRVSTNAQITDAMVVGLMSEMNDASHFAALDIGWAQELLGKQGRLTSIQILLEKPDEAEQVAARIRKIVPADVSVAPPPQRSAQVQNMLSAFQLNLTAMSMVSLLVGAFLIYNTISASVARRRTELGILRALGASRTEVRSLFLGEAMIFGAIGIALGCVGGIALARLLIGAVEETISSLYLLTSIERSFVEGGQFARAAVLGALSVLIGAWIPAEEASRVDPVGALRPGEESAGATVPTRRLTLAAAGFIALAALACAIALQMGPPLIAFIGAFFVLAGFGLLAPLAAQLTGRAAAAWTAAGALWRLAADHLRRSLARNAITVAALATAIAMTIGLTVMIHSFRESVTAWIERGIVADLFIAPASNEIIGLSAEVPAAPIAWLRAREGVDSVDTFREEAITAGSTPVLLAIVDGRYRDNLEFRGGKARERMARVMAGEAVAVTESLARKFRVLAGDHISLVTPAGPVEFLIAGVYSDYTRDQGAVLMIRALHDRHWPPAGPMSLAVYLEPGADPHVVADDFRRTFGRDGQFVIYTNRSIRERILEIFDQTFAVTYVLRTIALVVAALGIFLSVTTLVAERRRETAMLRALGATRGQVQKLFMMEAGMIGVVASLLGLACGVLLAMVLTWVVNPAFFGWTIHLHLPVVVLVTTPLWIIPAAILSAWIPAWQGSDEPIADSIREE